MFHTIPQALLDRMHYLGERDERDRQNQQEAAQQQHEAIETVDRNRGRQHPHTRLDETLDFRR